MSDPTAIYTKTRDQIAAARERRLSEVVDLNRIMLAALQMVANDVRSGSLPTQIQNAVIDAIAKAEGQSS